jgi:hypothetical protein
MSTPDNNSDLIGKKIFFLCPTISVQNRIVSALIQQEYEVYVAKNKEKIKKALSKYPDSIVLIDINEQMSEGEWDIWVTGIMEAPDMKGVSIGVVTSNDDEQIMRKFLLALKVPCGYTVVGHDIEKTITQLMAALQNVNAKGRRKYIRAIMEKGETTSTINLPVNGNFVNGVIKDISVVGISCTIEGNPDIAKNTLFKNIQVRLQTNLLKVEGILFGTRTDGLDTIYVILFTQRVDPDVRTKIRTYIQHTLQQKINPDLE